ncbi:PREDICTED: protein midgut expression 1 isoform X2 [Rhagoletis zephyria]|uniref:protein midgut expression 1 isoform X2 n=1 Tax=Rhagoletis zephyria TaxID=28612 RepID=UPI0008119661|nr:PREDICTED: protein midgut expression 1 isoform X2 [Rhagoletis zephyria]
MHVLSAVCCKCALNMFLGVFCSVIVLAVIIGLIVYFTVYYHKDSSSNNQEKLVRQVITAAPLTFKEYFQQQN